MITISLCMIVKNEEQTLGNCLESIRDIADEIIVVDTGSVDRTKELAAEYTDKIYDFEWTDDFSAARNFAFSKASMDYLMWLDADDILPPAEGEKLSALKETLSRNVDIVTMKYHTHFDENGIPIHTSTRGRLFKRNGKHRFLDPVHEYVPLAGNIHRSDIVIHHKKSASSGDRNLQIYERQLREGKKFSPRSTYYYARELRDHGRFGDAAHYFLKFLDEGLGWVEDNIAACHALAACYGALRFPEKRLSALVRSFTYDLPRPEICCELGTLYFEQNDFERAIFWYLLAAERGPIESPGFMLNDLRGYIPNLQLCVCYSRLGNTERAAEYNERAAAFKPDSPHVEHNRAYFASLLRAEAEKPDG